MAQALPYVYKGVNPSTGEFYIGSRVNNKDSFELDLPKYRTSSKLVKPRFDEFEWSLLMEFSNKSCAVDYEQYMIYQEWGNPLMLNRSCTYGHKKRFSTAGRDSTGNKNGFFGKQHSLETRERMKSRPNYFKNGGKHTEESKNKNRLSHLGKKLTEDHKAKVSASLIGNSRNLGKKWKDEDKLRLSEIRKGEGNSFYGRKHSDDSKKKVSLAKSGAKWFNNGEISVVRHSCPEGFQPGRLKAK